MGFLRDAIKGVKKDVKGAVTGEKEHVRPEAGGHDAQTAQEAAAAHAEALALVTSAVEVCGYVGGCGRAPACTCMREGRRCPASLLIHAGRVVMPSLHVCMRDSGTRWRQASVPVMPPPTDAQTTSRHDGMDLMRA